MAEIFKFIFNAVSSVMNIRIAVFEYTFTMLEVTIFMFVLYICASIIFGVFGGD